jgi:integrase
MTESNSTPEATKRKARQRKQTKPHKDFPLFPHASGRWAKKVHGKFHYFGSVQKDPQGQAALALWLQQKDSIFAGQVPPKHGRFSIADLCNRFLASKRVSLDTHELSPRTFAQYYKTCELIVQMFGKGTAVESLRPEDFERFRVGMPKTWGPKMRAKTIQDVRSIFQFAVEQDHVEKAIKFGKQFKGPSKKVFRLHRAKMGKRMFEADEIRKMLEAAGVQLRAMFLLAANCGFGNNDVASLPMAALDLERGWVDFPRPKTGIDRRCKLWPETVTAIREAMAKRHRPADKADNDILFLTHHGARWVTIKTVEQPDGTLKVFCDDSVSKETRKVMKRLGLNGHRAFYALRHTFETVGGGAKDQVAVDAIMGHVDDSMAGAYRERIDDERLADVAEYVRSWLFAKSKEEL